MSRRTSRASVRRPRPSRPARRPRGRRDLATAVAVVMGAGSLLSFDVSADGLTPEPPGDGPIAPAPTTDDHAVPDLRPGGFGLATVSGVPRVRRQADVRADQRADEERARERAEAERAAVWDRLADCESGTWDRRKQPVAGSARWDYGLRPSEDGFFQGGLQFHPVTWDEFRDPDMPGHAGEASRAQQIAIAERVLEVQGWEAWPVCSRKLGYR